MKRITIACGVLALLGTAAVIWQQHSLSRLRDTHKGFTSETGVEPVAVTNVALQQQIVSLREQTVELPMLRNEAGRLRAARVEMEGARADAARLLEAKQNGATTTLAPGFTSRQQLANVGFSTPEAAVQTFFWALSNGEMETAMGAFSPNNRERKSFEKLSPEKRAALMSETKRNGLDQSMAHFNDFGVRLREDLAEDQVALHVSSSVTTNTMRISLKKYGDEWRVEELP